MKSRQYTIRSVPEALDKALRQRAKALDMSLNSYILEVLEKTAQEPATPKIHHDLDFMFGSWVDDPEFDKAIKEFDVIDEEMWK